MLDWSKYIEVADRFEYKARRQDRGDLNHNIIVALADAQIYHDCNSGNQLSDDAMRRIASYQCFKYWRGVKRNARVISLNTVIADDEGNEVELIETLADDSIDLEGWLDRVTFELGYPDRAVQIARKIAHGYSLTNKEHQYLWRFRQKRQKKLL